MVVTICLDMEGLSGLLRVRADGQSLFGELYDGRS
jgi:hypothetical protein